MTQETINIILLLSPLVIGGIIAAVNSDGVNTVTEKVEAWTRRVKKKNSLKDNWFSRFVLNPIFWANVKFFDWTDDFKHRGVKSGTRVTVTLYILAAWCFILYAAFMIAVMIIIVGVILYVLFNILINSNDDVKRGYEKGKRTFNPKVQYNDDTFERENVVDYAGLKGKKIYSGTNWLTEELKGRIDEEGNIYKGTNWLTEEKIGRIDGDGNIYEGTTWLNEKKVGRIDEDRNLHKGTNWFNEKKTGRIDEDGDIQKGTSWLNEKKKGRIGD